MNFTSTLSVLRLRLLEGEDIYHLFPSGWMLELTRTEPSSQLEKPFCAGSGTKLKEPLLGCSFASV